ncbi:hypothetical protein MKW92_015837, partial [Papaver armeniacum]
LRCAFTMIKVFLNYTLIGILNWVDAQHHKPVYGQLLGLLIRKRRYYRRVGFHKRRLESREMLVKTNSVKNKWYELFTQ